MFQADLPWGSHSWVRSPGKALSFVATLIILQARIPGGRTLIIISAVWQVHIGADSTLLSSFVQKQNYKVFLKREGTYDSQLL